VAEPRPITRQDVIGAVAKGREDGRRMLVALAKARRNEDDAARILKPAVDNGALIVVASWMTPRDRNPLQGAWRFPNDGPQGNEIPRTLEFLSVLRLDYGQWILEPNARKGALTKALFTVAKTQVRLAVLGWAVEHLSPETVVKLQDTWIMSGNGQSLPGLQSQTPAANPLESIFDNVGRMVRTTVFLVAQTSLRLGVVADEPKSAAAQV
jgi:hypothetical protein